MKNTIIYVLFFLLLISSVNALTLGTGMKISDSNYNYTPIATINITSINTSTTLYLDGVEFCDSEYVHNFTTTRECYSDYDGGDSGSGSSGSGYVPPSTDTAFCSIKLSDHNIEFNDWDERFTIDVDNDENKDINLHYEITNYENPKTKELIKIKNNLSLVNANDTLEIKLSLNDLELEKYSDSADLMITAKGCQSFNLRIYINIEEEETLIDKITTTTKDFFQNLTDIDEEEKSIKWWLIIFLSLIAILGLGWLIYKRLY